jgi:hypothetical protein
MIKARKLIIVALLFFAAYGMTSCIKGRIDYEESSRILEKAAREYPLYRELDNLCRQIPVPDDFRLLGKRGLYRSKGVTYYYDSRLEFDPAEQYFREYFKSNGWIFSETDTISRGLEFTNERYRVTIDHGDQTVYSINCFQELDINK